MNDFIPYAKPYVSEAGLAMVQSVLTSDWLTTGPMLDMFEEQLQAALAAKFVYACANGTAALHLAFLALDIKPGDYVLVPAITFLASANAARFVGAEVIFVDVEADTGLMSSDLLEEAINKNKDKNLKAIVNVHMAGQCHNLKDIYNIAKKHSLWLIEDAAHAIGTYFQSNDGNKYLIGENKYSDLTTFSFHAVKTITTGEGGAVSTNNISLAEKIKLFRTHGMTSKSEIAPWYYEMSKLGFNYRLSDIHCALGCSQLKQLTKFKERRQELVALYDEFFKDQLNIKPLTKYSWSSTCWHLYVVFINFDNLKISRFDFIEQLKLKNIGTQVHYIPLYKQPYYEQRYNKILLPGSENYYQSALSLPLYSSLTIKQAQYVIDNVLELLK